MFVSSISRKMEKPNVLRYYHGIDGCGSNACSEMACFEKEAMPLCCALCNNGIVALSDCG